MSKIQLPVNKKQKATAIIKDPRHFYRDLATALAIVGASETIIRYSAPEPKEVRLN